MRKLLRILPDKIYISLLYWKHFKRFPDWKNPKTYSEKLQWLKLHDRRPEYTTMVDKYLAKQYIADKIGEKYIIPTLGVWESADQIDFDALPDQFVLKWNHGGGGKDVIICKDKACFDSQAAVDKLNKDRDKNAFWYGREWPYKNIQPRIIAEKMIYDNPENKDILTDFKFYCFDGHIEVVKICIGRHIDDLKFFFFDKEWNRRIVLGSGEEASEDQTFSKPKCFEEMLSIAEEISKGIPHVRIDLYEACGQIYFGEATLYSSSGFNTNFLHTMNLHFGSLINLDNVKRTRR